jgi:hypothetical protein
MQRLFDMGGQSGAGLLVLILYGLQAKERLHMARCCRFLHNLVSQATAWKDCPDLVTAYVGPNTSACTRHMPVSSTAMFFTARQQLHWMHRFHAFASTVRLRSLAFNYSCMSHISKDEYRSIIVHPPLLLHLECLTVLMCYNEMSEVLGAMPRLHTLQILMRTDPTDLQPLRASTSLTSLAFEEGQAWYQDAFDSCLAVVGTFPHLQRLHVTYPRLIDVLLFCQAIARNRVFTHLTVTGMSNERDPLEDLPGVCDFGPLSVVSIRGGGMASDFLNALCTATSLRQIRLHDVYPLESAEMLLRRNGHLCVSIFSSFLIGLNPETALRLDQLRLIFPNRFHFSMPSTYAIPQRVF